MVDEINFENNKKNSREIHQVILLIFDSIRDQSLSLYFWKSFINLVIVRANLRRTLSQHYEPAICASRNNLPEKSVAGSWKKWTSYGMCRVFFEAGLEFFDGEYKCPVEGMQPEVTRRKHFFGRTFCTGLLYVVYVITWTSIYFYFALLHVYTYIYIYACSLDPSDI